MTTGAPRGRIVILEGLPGSGKSTTAHLLRLHLQDVGLDARWWWEHEQPHPIFDYSVIQEALDDGLLQAGLFERAIGNWQKVVRKAEWVVLDGSFFQTPLHAMLLLDWEPDGVAEYIRHVEAVLTAAQPLIVLLQAADPAAALAETAASRGDWFMELLEWRIRHSAYGCRRGLAGVLGVTRYFAAYSELVERLAAQLVLPVLTLRGAKSAFVDRISAALGLPPSTGFEPAPPAAGVLVGAYRAADAYDCYRVVMDGADLWLDGVPRTRLIPRHGLLFELVGTCVTFEFRCDAAGRAEGLRCLGNLPGLVRDWVRVA